ncbi:unnamed protein product [Trichobilharzia szidati]|nr:unnamed protein product [Trichobilharzia szidati]
MECVRLLKKAYELDPCDKIKRKIERIENHLKENEISSDDTHEREESPDKKAVSKVTGELIQVADGFHVPKLLYDKLYDYQKSGIEWLWSLHQKNSGGILADDMGLGKTVQVIAFLSGLFVSSKSNCTALIVMPVSVLATWETELKRWAPALRVVIFHDTSRSDRLKSLVSIQRHGGILLTTYGMLVSNIRDLSTDLNANPDFLRSKKPSNKDNKNNNDDDNDVNDILARTGKEFHWTYLILDEGHKVKNPSSKTTKAAQAIYAKHCILLTGTAVQNNLKELWSLFNVTHRGRLLGTQKTFSIEYDKPISRGREKDASKAEKVHGQLMSESLRKIIDPYFLRRTKSDVLSKKYNMNALVPMKNEMPRKTEIVLWIYLSTIQENTYRDFLQLDHVKELLMKRTTRSPLMELIILKKVCDHPRLLSTEQCLNLNLHHDDDDNTVGGQDSQRDTYPIDKLTSDKIHFPPAEQLIKESGKFLFLHCLMKQFLKELQMNPQRDSPRTLIFSQSLKFLDMAEKVILDIHCPVNSSGQSSNPSGNFPTRHRVLRLDGRTSKVCDRLSLINKFQNDKSYTVMLLTTQVGGVGLTITSANRVIILDPSWNPAVDAQAVDRAYRIGQKFDVVVYRLITCATVEEKIYRRQIFKDSVIRQTTAPGQNKTDLDPYRYFSRQELFELFSLGDTRVSETKKQLDMLHDGSDKWSDASISPHLHFLCGDAMKHAVYGISFHDLMFSKESVNEGSVDTTDHENVYIMNRRVAAERALAVECGVEGKAFTREVSTTDVRNDNNNNVNSLPTQLANMNIHNNNRFPPYAYNNSNNNNNNNNTENRFMNPVLPNQQLLLFKPSKDDTQRHMFNRPPTKQVDNGNTLTMSRPQMIVSSNDNNSAPISNNPERSNEYTNQISNVVTLTDNTTTNNVEHRPINDEHGVGKSISPKLKNQLPSSSKVPVDGEYLEIGSSSSSEDNTTNNNISMVDKQSVVSPVSIKNRVVDYITIEDSIAESLREMSIAQTTPLRSNNANDSKESDIPKTPLHENRAPLNPRLSFLPMDGNFYRSTPISTKKSANERNSNNNSNNDNNNHVGGSDKSPSRVSPVNNDDPDQDYIHMDISVNMNDNDLANTVDMKSIQQVLARSGVLNATNVVESDAVDRSVSDSEERVFALPNNISSKRKPNHSTPARNNSKEIVMDSYASGASLEDDNDGDGGDDDVEYSSEDIIEESDIVEASY